MSTALSLRPDTVEAPAPVRHALVPVRDLQVMAQQVARSRLFGMDESQAFTLMLLAEARGLLPIQAVERYHVIQGKPSMKADAMLAEFQARGGSVDWLKHDHDACEGVFRSPAAPKPVTVAWTIADAKRAELFKNPMWAKYPRQMLRARVTSEGIRMVMPGIIIGVYTPEEVADMRYADRPDEPAQAAAASRPGPPAIESSPGRALEPPKAEPAPAPAAPVGGWKAWAEGIAKEVNSDFRRELADAGVAEAQRSDLASFHSLTNALVSIALETDTDNGVKLVAFDKIAKRDAPDKRDGARVGQCAEWLYNRWPEWCTSAVGNHLVEKRVRARAHFQIPEPGAAENDGDGTDPLDGFDDGAGKGDAWEPSGAVAPGA